MCTASFKNLTAGLAALLVTGGAATQDLRGLFKAPSGATMSVAAGAQPTVAPAKSPQYSGLMYSIFQIAADGKEVRVDPGKVFRTGDRIRVEAKSARDGVLTAFTVDPRGKTDLIFQKNVVSGETYTVPATGNLRFLNEKGDEKIVFSLSSGPKPRAAEEIKTIAMSCVVSVQSGTRGLAVEQPGASEYAVSQPDGSCGKGSGLTRGLIVERHENSSYGVVSDQLINSGAVMFVTITLKHR